jgi:hypothetical protein
MPINQLELTTLCNYHLLNLKIEDETILKHKLLTNHNICFKITTPILVTVITKEDMIDS